MPLGRFLHVRCAIDSYNLPLEITFEPFRALVRHLLWNLICQGVTYSDRCLPGAPLGSSPVDAFMCPHLPGHARIGTGSAEVRRGTAGRMSGPGDADDLRIGVLR